MLSNLAVPYDLCVGDPISCLLTVSSAFSVIVKTDGSFAALNKTRLAAAHTSTGARQEPLSLAEDTWPFDNFVPVTSMDI